MLARPAVLSAFTLLAACAATVPDTVDSYVTAEIRRERIPGLALGVYRRGEIIKAQGYGLANVELQVPVKPETIFQSGSVGKQFTATAIMMLVEEGKIDPDAAITHYLDRAPDFWKAINVKNLLSHTSGLAEYESATRTKPDGPFYLRLDHTEDELLDRIYRLPMDFRPGERWRYTNTNYVVLGVLIHKVTGQFYGDYLAQHIFRPLGMNATRIISERDIIPNRSAGYELVKGELKNQDWVSPTFNSTADGALYFNVLDLAKWDAALYTEQLVKKSTLARMWTVFPLNGGQPNSGNYGFAWSINKVNGHTVIEHGGAWQGFTTAIARFVDDSLTVVVLTNLDAAHARPGKIAHQVAGIYNPALAPPRAKAIADTEPERTAFVQNTLESIAAGKADPQSFTPEARAFFFPERVKEIADALKDQGGAAPIEVLERNDKGDEPVRRYRFNGKDGSALFTVRFSQDGKIAGLRFELE
jgi:CubicO group peptidase (beta-lactamase class C family)